MGTHRVWAIGDLWRATSAGSRDDSQVFWISALRVWWEPTWGWEAWLGLQMGCPALSLSPPSVKRNARWGTCLCAWSCTGLTENVPTPHLPAHGTSAYLTKFPPKLTKSPGSDRTKCPTVSEFPVPPPSNQLAPYSWRQASQSAGDLPGGRCPGC